MKFIVTNHAIKRYQERVERCSKTDAKERLLHAASIARMATNKQMEFARSHFGSGMNAVWCEIENLFMPVRRLDGDELLITTVYRLPSDSECRRLDAERRRLGRQKKRKRSFRIAGEPGDFSGALQDER